MRKKMFDGFDPAVIYFTDKQWRELLKRFDLSRVVKVEGENKYEIPSDGCYLCKAYRSGIGRCCDCPLSTDLHTCGDFMEEVVGVGTYFEIRIEPESGVWWYTCKDEDARRHVRKIYEALMSMERVGRRGR